MCADTYIYKKKKTVQHNLSDKVGVLLPFARTTNNFKSTPRAKEETSHNFVLRLEFKTEQTYSRTYKILYSSAYQDFTH